MSRFRDLGRRPGPALAVLLAGCGVVATLSGCAAAPTPEPERTRAAAPAPAESRSVFEVGDCFDNTPVSGSTPTPTVDCAEAHDNEVYAVVVLEGDKYPGSGELRRTASEACDEAFPDELNEAGLIFFPIAPSELMWERDGDRSVVCALYDESGSMEGSALPGA